MRTVLLLMNDNYKENFIPFRYVAFGTLVYFVSFRCIRFISFRIMVNFLSFRFAFQYISLRFVIFRFVLLYFVSISFRSLVQPQKQNKITQRRNETKPKKSSINIICFYIPDKTFQDYQVNPQWQSIDIDIVFKEIFNGKKQMRIQDPTPLLMKNL